MLVGNSTIAAQPASQGCALCHKHPLALPECPQCCCLDVPCGLPPTRARCAAGLTSPCGLSPTHTWSPSCLQANEEGRLLEVFGSGTACIVQPVGALVRCGWAGLGQ